MLPDPDPNVPEGADEKVTETDTSQTGEVDNQATEETASVEEGTASEESTEGSEKAAPEATETEAEEPSEADAELDDATLEAIAEVYGDRLLASKKLGEANAKAIRDEVSKQVTSAKRSQEVDGENAGVIQRGRTAVESFATKTKAIQAEFAKASRGETFDAAIADGEDLGTYMKEFGSAVLAGTQAPYERAIQEGFNKLLVDLPELSDPQATELQGITDTWRRMKNDPQQVGESQAFLVDKLYEFAIPLARAAGAQEERERSKKGKVVKERITSKNAVTAAKAEIEKHKAPPKSPGSAVQSKKGASIEEYERLVAAGDRDGAEAVLHEMERMTIR